MGIFSKMKNAVTGGAAKVSIEYTPGTYKPGDSIPVKVTVASSTQDEVKSKGIFVDVQAVETGSVSGCGTCPNCQNNINHRVEVDHTTFQQQIPLYGAFTLKPNEVKVVEGKVNIPPTAQPTYHGSLDHTWSVRGRLEALGNDPDSGFYAIIIR